MNGQRIEPFEAFYFHQVTDILTVVGQLNLRGFTLVAPNVIKGNHIGQLGGKYIENVPKKMHVNRMNNKYDCNRSRCISAMKE